MDGVVPDEFAKLFNIVFTPNLQRYPIDTRYLEYVKLGKGRVISIPDIDTKLEAVGVTEVNDPEEVKAAEALLRLFAEFTYISTLLATGGKTTLIKSAGSQQFGFSPLHIGHLTSDTVKRLSEAMQEMPRKEFTQMLVKQTGNPVFVSL